MRSKAILIGVSLAVAASTAAQASVVKFAVKADRLYRISNGTVEPFTLSDSLNSLTATSHGIIGISNTTTGNPDEFQVYRLDGAFGPNPTLTQIGIHNTRRPAITEINGTLYGVGEIDELVILDWVDFTATLVGHMGTPQGVGGTGYDPVNDKFYMTNHGSQLFYEVDYTNADVTPIGSLGLNFTNQGGEFFDGVYYAALEDLDNDTFVIGTIDVATGIFTETMVLETGLNPNEPIGLAVIPAPGTLGMLGLAGLLATRRRR